MQSVSDLFTQYAQGSMRPINWAARISFEKNFDEDIDFFTIGESLIGGGDFIPGSGSVVQEWDKYIYSDFTDRIISMEWSREVEAPFSVVLATADIVLNNYDDYFTPGKGSPIDDYILPYRPIRLYAGFGEAVLPVFIGLTEKMPIIDEKSKTASFHCIDFLHSIFNYILDDAVLYIDKRTNEILEELFTLAGVLPSQLNLDEGYNVIPYASMKKDARLGDIVRKLVEAEFGRLYMDEQGIINFKARESYDDATVYYFDAYNNIVNSRVRKQEEIINVVEINSNRLEEAAKTEYYQRSGGTVSADTSVLIPAGESRDIWAEFQDPVTSVDEPEYEDSATTSSFSVNDQADGSGTPNSTDVTLDSYSLFAETYKMTFKNDGASDLYVTDVILYATPIVIAEPIYIKQESESSKDKFDERIYKIDNEYIQNASDAESIATIILADYSDYDKIAEIEVKGHMALQLDDAIEVNVFDNIDTYKIKKITNKISQPMKYTQLLQVKPFETTNFFTIGESLIGGDDVIKP